MKTSSMILLTFSVLLGLVLTQNTVLLNNPGCRSRDSNDRCIQCSYRFYLDRNTGICQPVNPQCNTFNPQNGDCRSCYGGFVLIDNTCLLSSALNFNTISDVNCRRFESNKCVQCSVKFYFGLNGLCQQVDPNCDGYNMTNGRCTSCFTGFRLTIDGQCLQAPNTVLDPYCSQFKDKVCQKCSQGFYFNDFRICTQIDPNCKSFNYQQRRCQKCYEGFSLAPQNDCIKSTDNPQIILPAFCRVFDNGVCQQCVTRAYFNSQRVCTQVSPDCQQYSINNFQAFCTKCYSGYQLNQASGRCTKSLGVLSDPFCKQFSNGQCKTCSFRYFKNNRGLCQLISPLCNGYDSSTGACKSCYEGFILSGRDCVQNPTFVSDPLCANFTNGICVLCSKGSFFNLQKARCELINPNCRTYNQNNGACYSCFKGFTPIAGNCVKDQNFQNRDPFCSEFDENNKCKRCSNRYISGQNGLCKKVSDLCNGYSQSTGKCNTCYVGYQLNQNTGQCFLIPPSQQSPTVNLNCAKIGPNNSCIQCVKRFVLDNNGGCRMVNPLCKDYNRNGDCTDCYSVFILRNGACVLNNVIIV